MIKRLCAALAVFAVIATLFLIPLSLRAAMGVQNTHHPVTTTAVLTPDNPHPIFRVHVRTPVQHSVRTVVRVIKDYAVKGGDTLWSIAHHAHMSWQRLYQLNRGVIGPNPNLIYPGMELLL